jgi:hypothetical protein
VRSLSRTTRRDRSPERIGAGRSRAATRSRRCCSTAMPCRSRLHRRRRPRACRRADLSQSLQRGDRGRRTELFGKLAAGCLLRILRCAKFALWDRPSAVVLVAPEGTTGVDQQDLEAALSATIGQYARAHVRSCGRSLRRAHVFSFCCSLEPRRIARPMFKRRNGRSRRRPGCLGRSLPLRPGSLLRGIGRKCG